MNIIEELYGASYSLPSENDEWVERQGDTVPMNVCTRAADEIQRLRAVIDGAMPLLEKALALSSTGYPDDRDIAEEIREFISGHQQSGNKD